MRALVIASVLAAIPATLAVAADKLTPDAIKTTFFTGQEFTAATPSGVKFKMVFTLTAKLRAHLLPVQAKKAKAPGR
jgi:hypothetical protein